MKNFAFISVAFAAVLAGCDDGSTGGETACEDTAGCDTATDPLLIDSFTYTCEADTSAGCGADCGSLWNYTIVVTGSNSGGLVIIDQDTTDPWSETHDLTGSGTTLSVDLVGAHVSDQTANVSSLFQCDMDTNMAWRYEVYPPEGGSVPADCVVATGSQVDPAVFYGADFGGCANGNSW